MYKDYKYEYYKREYCDMHLKEESDLTQVEEDILWWASTMVEELIIIMDITPHPLDWDPSVVHITMITCPDHDAWTEHSSIIRYESGLLEQDFFEYNTIKLPDKYEIELMEDFYMNYQRFIRKQSRQ